MRDSTKLAKVSCEDAMIVTGSFGSVYKIRRKSDGMIMVWKEIFYERMSERERQQLVGEVKILQQLSHPNIVKYYDK
jgi:serine/threonine protein kinase